MGGVAASDCRRLVPGLSQRPRPVSSRPPSFHATVSALEAYGALLRSRSLPPFPKAPWLHPVAPFPRPGLAQTPRPLPRRVQSRFRSHHPVFPAIPVPFAFPSQKCLPRPGAGAGAGEGPGWGGAGWEAGVGVRTDLRSASPFCACCLGARVGR